MSRIILVTLFCLLTFSAAKADSVELTSGTIIGITEGVDNPYSMVVSGVNFSLRANGEVFHGPNAVFPPVGGPYTATPSIGTFTTMASVVRDGIAYNSVKMTGVVFFSTFLVTMPTDTTSTSISGIPFTMTGNLQFLEFDNTPIFSVALTGQGTMAINFRYVPDINRFFIRSMVFTLQPTPEPSTLILLGSSLVGSAMAYRKRRG